MGGSAFMFSEGYHHWILLWILLGIKNQCLNYTCLCHSSTEMISLLLDTWQWRGKTFAGSGYLANKYLETE